MDKKTPGRPRLYASAAEKVDAFRQRQGTAGYLRKEILVTRETWDQVSGLALAHQVSASDVASGLLEHGLAAFSSAPPEGTSTLSGPTDCALLPTRGVLLASTVGASAQGTVAPIPGAASALTAPRDNPITRFFAKRKDSSNA